VSVRVGKAPSVTWSIIFAERNTVILPDLSGSKAAEDDGSELTIEMLAEQVSAVIADVGSEPVDLLGFSLGGSVVAATAALRPEQVRGLVPVGGLVETDAYIRNLIGLTLSLADNAEAFGRVLTTTAFSPRYINSLDSMEEVDKLGAELSPSLGRLRQLELLVRVDIRGLVERSKRRLWWLPAHRMPRSRPSTLGNFTPRFRAPPTSRSIVATWCSLKTPRIRETGQRVHPNCWAYMKPANT
jgi:pimeloyl-ACP methyl ester carboxylesterase